MQGEEQARLARLLLAASGTSDIAEAHVVICARRSQQRVITSDPGDLRALDPAIQRLHSDKPAPGLPLPGLGYLAA